MTGIGFLGAGAIIKYGTSIRGLTTAGSVWATVAIGMAAGAGQIIVAVVGTAIVVFSLWPLNRIVDRLRISRDRTVRVRLQLGGLDRVGAITTELAARRVEIAGIEAQRSGKSRFEVELDLRAPATMRPDAPLELITSIPDVDVLESSSLGE